MYQFEITRHLFGRELTAHIVRLDAGIHVLIYGGNRSHVGAVSIVDQGKVCETTQFPGHKDGIVSEMWAKALARTHTGSIVVAAGIHYDNLTGEDIKAILSATEEMLDRTQMLLSSIEKENSTE